MLSRKVINDLIFDDKNEIKKYWMIKN